MEVIHDTNALNIQKWGYQCERFSQDLQLQKAITVDAKIGDLTDMYLPRLKWTQNNNQVAVIKLNRLQNHLQLLFGRCQQRYFFCANEGKSKLITLKCMIILISGRWATFYLDLGKKWVQFIYVYNMQGKRSKAAYPKWL